MYVSWRSLVLYVASGLWSVRCLKQDTSGYVLNDVTMEIDATYT